MSLILNSNAKPDTPDGVIAVGYDQYGKVRWMLEHSQRPEMFPINYKGNMCVAILKFEDHIINFYPLDGKHRHTVNPKPKIPKSVTSTTI